MDNACFSLCSHTFKLKLCINYFPLQMMNAKTLVGIKKYSWKKKSDLELGHCIPSKNFLFVNAQM